MGDIQGEIRLREFISLQNCKKERSSEVRLRKSYMKKERGDQP